MGSPLQRSHPTSTGEVLQMGDARGSEPVNPGTRYQARTDWGMPPGTPLLDSSAARDGLERRRSRLAAARVVTFSQTESSRFGSAERTLRPRASPPSIFRRREPTAEAAASSVDRG